MHFDNLLIKGTIQNKTKYFKIVNICTESLSLGSFSVSYLGLVMGIYQLFNFLSTYKMVKDKGDIAQRVDSGGKKKQYSPKCT